MPRVWKPRYGVSAFADLLVQRMTDHIPPLQPHHVAKYLGVDQAVVSNWLNRGSKPGAPVCSMLAALFEDAPELWYRAAGRQTSETWAVPRPAREPSPRLGTMIGTWEATAQAIINDPRVPEAAKADLLAVHANVARYGDPYAHHKATEYEYSGAQVAYDPYVQPRQMEGPPPTWEELIALARQMPWDQGDKELYIRLTFALQFTLAGGSSKDKDINEPMRKPLKRMAKQARQTQSPSDLSDLDWPGWQFSVLNQEEEAPQPKPKDPSATPRPQTR